VLTRFEMAVVITKGQADGAATIVDARNPQKWASSSIKV